MKNPRQAYYDIERIIEFDFVRATEAAALNTIKWVGRGEKEKADAAACDAIRGMFDLMNVCGEVVIGEGIKDNAPGIFKGEHLGTWTPGSIKFDLALDPVDGTTNVAKGRPNSISCIAAASPADGAGASLADLPSFYTMKLAYGQKVIRYMQRTGFETVSIRNSIEDNLTVVAKALGKRVQDLVVVVLNRPRHDQLVEEIRRIGAALRMIQDGDITAAIAPSIPDSGIDLYLGIGGSPEAVLSAAGIKCLGGGIQCRMWPNDAAEKEELTAAGYDFEKVYYADDLAVGNNIVFTATGISDSPLLPGVRLKGNIATTSSVLMRAKSRTIRFLQAQHDLDTKTIYLRSDKREHRL